MQVFLVRALQMLSDWLLPRSTWLLDLTSQAIRSLTTMALHEMVVKWRVLQMRPVHCGFGKLIAFYDGDTEIAFTENVDERFKGLGWSRMETLAMMRFRLL
ncbi:hypothetical protein GQ457_05G000250 [Hibiscus cannabinus]